MDLKLVKGTSLENYLKYAKADDYEGALFFDLTSDKIYLTQRSSENSRRINVIAMDSNIRVEETADSDGVRHKTLVFSSCDGDVRVAEAEIPEVDHHGCVVLQHSKAGLMSGLDKYVLDNIASALGVHLIYNGDGTAKFMMDPGIVSSILQERIFDDISMLYNKDYFTDVAYDGLMVTITQNTVYGKGSVWILQDSTPFVSGSGVEINKDNFQDYWQHIHTDEKEFSVTWYDFEDDDEDEESITI